MVINLIESMEVKPRGVVLGPKGMVFDIDCCGFWSEDGCWKWFELH